MTFSRLLFLAAFALLTLASCNAWGVIQGLRQTRPHKASDILKAFLALLCVASLCSCGAQVVTKNDGTRIANVTVLSKTSLDVNADGSVNMRADANVAAKEIGKGVDRAIGAGLVKQGIGALQSVGNNVVESVTK